MELGLHRSFKISAPGSSLRRRVAYSLAIVRLILVPVIFLAVYYLFEMGLIVDRIVNVDAPAATLAEQASVQMLDARRDERSYFLLREAEYVQANQEALHRLRDILGKIRDIASEENLSSEDALNNVNLYERQFKAAVAVLANPDNTAGQRVRAVVLAYERNLDDLLKQTRHKTRAQLVDNLRGQVDSFDAQITSTVEAGDPVLRGLTPALQASSDKVLQIASAMEGRSWKRVQQDHQQARTLLHRAEWVLSIVSGITFLLSVWISFILPRQVVKPLLQLKDAVDQAASGEYKVELELHGEGELVELAKSVRNLIARVRQKA